MSEFGPNVEGVSLSLIRDRLEVFEMVWKDYRRRNVLVSPETLGIVYKLTKSGIVDGDAVRGSKLPNETARKASTAGYSPAERTGITQRVKGLISSTDFYSRLPQSSLQEFFGDTARKASS